MSSHKTDCRGNTHRHSYRDPCRDEDEEKSEEDDGRHEDLLFLHRISRLIPLDQSHRLIQKIEREDDTEQKERNRLKISGDSQYLHRTHLGADQPWSVPEEQRHQAQDEDIGNERDPLATGLRKTIIDKVYRNFPLLPVNNIGSKKRHPHEQKDGQREYPNQRIVKEPPQEDVKDVREKHDSEAKNCNHLADLCPSGEYLLDHPELPSRQPRVPPLLSLDDGEALWGVVPDRS